MKKALQLGIAERLFVEIGKEMVDEHGKMAYIISAGGHAMRRQPSNAEESTRNHE